jgi:hypothetical protein
MANIGDTFHTGETCIESGVYRYVNCNGFSCSPGQYEIPLSKGERFPPCKGCKTAVTWKLVRYA